MNTNTLSEIDVEMIFKLIKWAEQDEKFLNEFATWGKWNQGLWGAADENFLRNMFGDPEDPEAMKVVRNGECQTAFCMAGQAAVQTGHRLIFNDTTDIHNAESSSYIAAVSAAECVPQEPVGRDEKGRVIYRDVEGESPRYISDVAREALGLEYEEADRFFNGDNGITDLKEYANWFCNRRNLPLLFPDADIYDDGESDDISF